MSTPKGDGSFNVYDDLKRKLMEKEIAFIHDANTEAKKTELFGKVKSGQVRFLIGSTAKMGAGTNVQDRLLLCIIWILAGNRLIWSRGKDELFVREIIIKRFIFSDM